MPLIGMTRRVGCDLTAVSPPINYIQVPISTSILKPQIVWGGLVFTKTSPLSCESIYKLEKTDSVLVECKLKVS